MYVCICHVFKGYARLKDSIRLPWGADGTGLVMGTGAGIQGCGQKGLEHGRRQTSGCDRAAGLGWAEKGGCCI